MGKWLNNKSRMKREFHVRFCERLAGKFRWPTRPVYGDEPQVGSFGDGSVAGR
jgi:hypothetical protein